MALSEKKPNRLLLIAYALAALAGLTLGFDAGYRISGVFLGVVMGLNMAVIAAVCVGMVAGWLGRRRTPAAPRPGNGR